MATAAPNSISAWVLVTSSTEASSDFQNPFAADIVLDAEKAASVAILPLNPRGICETDAIQMGAQLWLVTEWHHVRPSPGIWRPKRMIQANLLRCSPMRRRLVLADPMSSQVFNGRQNQVWL